jgi:penicillin-binding protein 2
MMIARKKQRKQSDPFVIKEGSLSYGNFNGKYHRDWVEEAFTPTERGEETVGNKLPAKYLLIMRWVAVLFLVILGVRLLWLQAVQGGYYRDMANGNRLRLERVEANRGIIFDATGKPLVHNVANFLLYCVPADLPKNITERDNLIDRLALETKKFDATAIKKQINDLKPSQMEYYQPLFIADNIEYNEALKIYLESFSVPGLVLSSINRRNYDLPAESLSHVLGYTGKISPDELANDKTDYSSLDYLGKTGLEKSWESELRGVPGVKQVEVDALGKEKTVVSETSAIAGNNLMLSIDATAQAKLEEIMNKYISQAGLKKGAAVVLNPQTGEVISLISLPAFDDNAFAQGITEDQYQALANNPDQPLFSRAVSGEYPSGSTIKPIYAGAALQEGIINENTQVLSTGGLHVGQWFFPDWKAGGHGLTDVKKALAESVNTFFYYIGGGYDNFVGLGVDKMSAYLRKFLIGTPLGIDLPNEGSGFVPTKDWKEATKKEKWYIGDTYHLAIGQGDLIVTPLQVAAYTMYFANGGTMYRPHVVSEVVKPTGEVVEKIAPQVIAKGMLSSANINIVREGLRQTVTSGSARSLNTLPVEVAGKTGTAQWSTKKDPHAWFTGFAPYDNPTIVITILVEEGKGGDVIASPIAKEFLQWYFGEYKKQ